jgi:hypothetical protein
VDSANEPYEAEPYAAIIANLTRNPGIVYDLFINNPEVHVGGQLGTLEELLEGAQAHPRTRLTYRSSRTTLEPADDEVEIGVGVHSEPSRRRDTIKPVRHAQGVAVGFGRDRGARSSSRVLSPVVPRAWGRPVPIEEDQWNPSPCRKRAA